MTFIVKIYSLLVATIVIIPSRMVYNTAASSAKIFCTDSVDFGKCQDRFRPFFGPKMTPFTWTLFVKYSRETATKTFHWFEITQWEKQILSSTCGWGISWWLQQRTLVDRITRHQNWYRQCPETWMNNSRRMIRWLI